ncbi:MAG TPA: LLM class flavin-dependent oxidoreductase [Ilumatobacteraceae bacterium]|nr:LLM class flavin-dependent oxidoreductase [Ilumatobacteraceae bacterium]
MDYYGFNLVGAYAGRPHIEAIDDLLDLIESADGWGLDGWYFAEHHGQPLFSLSSAPSLLIAAAARRTTNIRLGTMVNVLPFLHPARLADELRTLDALCGGRLDVGFGRGQIRVEQHAFGVDRSATVAMFDAAFDIVVRLLRGETVDYDTPWWNGSDAIAVPEATQTPTPPLWISAASIDSIEKCAMLGVGCATALLTREIADERMAQYRKFWTEYQPQRSGEARFAIAATIAVADNEDEAIAQVAQDLQEKQEHFAHSISDKPGADDETYSTHKPVYEAYATSTLASMLDDGLLIAGSVEQCIDQVARIRARGVDRLICTFHNGQADFDFSKRSLELFTTQVIPAVSNG